jgi:hypothetical protein
MHLGQDLLGKSLGNPRIRSVSDKQCLTGPAICGLHALIDGSGTTSSLDASLLSLGD